MSEPNETTSGNELPTHPEFETFDWKGQTRYRCNLKWESGSDCLYDTYDLGAMREHLRGPHNRTGKRPRPAVRQSPIVSPTGEPFETVVDPAFASAAFHKD